MSKESMKLALEALEMVDRDDNDRDFLFPNQCYQLDEAITALREALAEQQTDWEAVAADQALTIALLKAKQPAQQQEPVAFSQFLSDVVTAAGLLSHGKTDKSLAARISEFAFRMRTSPPASKPLTDEEIDALREKHSEGRGAGWRFDFKGFARAIEAAHGIKGDA